MWNFPREINHIRDRTINYEPMAALNLMRQANLIAESQLTYELSAEPLPVYSGVGYEISYFRNAAIDQRKKICCLRL